MVKTFIGINPVDAGRKRLLAGLSAALAFHALLFVVRFPEQILLISPQAQQVQRIAVSLGTRTATEKPQLQQELKDLVKRPPEEKKTVEITDSPAASSLVQPKVLQSRQRAGEKTAPVPGISAEPNYKKKIVPLVTIHDSVPGGIPLKTDFSEENSATGASPRIIQKASPLYELNPAPQYPRLARRRGQEGVVVLDVSVDEYGRAAEVALFVSSGYPLLDKAALKAVRYWRFQSGTINGIARRMKVKVPIRFRLSRR